MSPCLASLLLLPRFLIIGRPSRRAFNLAAAISSSFPFASRACCPIERSDSRIAKFHNEPRNLARPSLCKLMKCLRLPSAWQRGIGQGQGGRKSEMEGVIGYVENTVPYRKPRAIFRRLNYRREFFCKITSPQAVQCWLRYRHYI
jgi:hypothetical protein